MHVPVVLALSADGIRFYSVGGVNLEQKELRGGAGGVRAGGAIRLLKRLVERHIAPVDRSIPKISKKKMKAS